MRRYGGFESTEGLRNSHSGVRRSKSHVTRYGREGK